MAGCALYFSGDPIREWDVDGESHVALHPLILVANEALEAEGAKLSIDASGRRVAEYLRNERQLSREQVQRLFDVDALQRENGYAGP